MNNNKWIPVNKELPKEKGWYQCTCSDKEVWSRDIVRDLYYYPELKEFVDNIRYSDNGCKNIENYYWTKYVTAWQPLPAPYNKDSDVMNNDLISRKALIDKFYATLRYFDIDDKTKIVIEELIECIPTVYNVEKVMEQIKDVDVSYCDSINCDDGCSYCSHAATINAVIDVIIKGGVEE